MPCVVMCPCKAFLSEREELFRSSAMPVAGEGAVSATRATNTPWELSCRKDAAARGVGPCLCAFLPACGAFMSF